MSSEHLRSSAMLLAFVMICLPGPSSGVTLNDFLTRSTSEPDLTDWRPEGERLASLEELTSTIIPARDRFTTLHGGMRSTDEVGIVFAPVFERTWTAETGAFVAESPTFDQDGNAYFVPLFPTESGQNMLIKLDGTTGERQWAVTRDMVGDATLNLPNLGLTTFPATLGQGGAPLILNDPDTGRPVIYSGSYSKVYAVDEDGNILWSKVGVPLSLLVHRALPPSTHLFGVHYHPHTDTILYEYGPGDIVAYDRATGRRKGSLFLPGAPAPSAGGFNIGEGLPEDVQATLIEMIRETLAESFDIPSFGDVEVVSRLLNALLGGGSLITNDFAVDPNTSSIWVASTDLDEADGTVDGVSELGALYRIDITDTVHPVLGPRVLYTTHCHASFEGGTASTPAVSPDGLRIYTSDNRGRALAFDRDCNLVWSVDTGETAVASLSVSSHVGAEIYYPTARSIIKIQENKTRDGARIKWSADIASSFVGGRFNELLSHLRDAAITEIESRIGKDIPDDFVRIEANNLDLATIGQNGIMVHGGFGLKFGADDSALLLPVALNIGLYDRDTGELINATPAVEENIGAMYTGPDGTIAMGSSPIRRVAIRALATLPAVEHDLPPELKAAIDFIVPPLTGGVTKYGVTQRFDLIARDAVCQASRILRNTRAYAPGNVGQFGVEADIRDALRLATQAEEALAVSKVNLEVKEAAADNISGLIEEARSGLAGGQVDVAYEKLRNACFVGKNFTDRKRSGIGKK